MSTAEKMEKGQAGPGADKDDTWGKLVDRLVPKSKGGVSRQQRIGITDAKRLLELVDASAGLLIELEGTGLQSMGKAKTIVISNDKMFEIREQALRLSAAVDAIGPLVTS